jgi:hypothetical protein
MVETIPPPWQSLLGPIGMGTPLVCKEGNAGGRTYPFIFSGKHGCHPDRDGLFTVWKVVFYVRKWDVGEGEDRAQNIKFFSTRRRSLGMTGKCEKVCVVTGGKVEGKDHKQSHCPCTRK